MKQNIVVQKSWSFSYMRYRVLRPFLKLYTSLLRFPSNNKPWLAPAAISILDQVLNKSMTILEYGSGSSTRFLAERAGKVISVEHHPEWFRKVEQDLEVHKVTNVEYHLIEPDEKLENKKEIERRFKKPFREENQNYRSYFSFIEKFEDDYFDLILIDGRARVECLKRAIPKLKTQGIMILDNSEREEYKPVAQILLDWKSVQTTTGLTDTTFWFKV